MTDKVWNLLVKYFYEWKGLLAGYALIFIVFPKLNESIKYILPEKSYQYIFYIIISALWLAVWILLRNHLPRSEKYKIGIVIAIDAENLKQKTRIKVDFVSRLRELLGQHNFLQLFDILVLDDYKARRSIKILQDYSYKIIEIRKQIASGLRINERPKEVVRWEKYQKKIHGHFFVWGNIKERLDEQNKYFLNIYALVVHKPVDIKTGDNVRKEFLSIFPKEISFFEKFEVRGFRFTADTIYFAVRYITGIAALISGDPYTAIKLHDKLKDEINTFPKPLPPNLKHIYDELDKLLSEEKLFIAKHCYYIERNVSKAKELIDSCLDKSQVNYDALIFSSIIAFKTDKDPLASLKFLNRASKCSNGDYTWLYNKAFLLMYLGKFNDGVKAYKKLTNVSFNNEVSITHQCINFNEELLKGEPDKIQALFVMGFLYYRKLNNLPMALEYFEQFINKARAMADCHYLLEVSKSYISEIKPQMLLDYE